MGSWVLGEVDTMMEGEKSKIPRILVKSEKIVPSPDWDKWTTKGDIALVKLAQKVDLKTYTPACLAKTGDNFDGKKAMVYGWGQLAWDNYDPPSLLQKLEVTSPPGRPWWTGPRRSAICGSGPWSQACSVSPLGRAKTPAGETAVVL